MLGRSRDIDITDNKNVLNVALIKTNLTTDVPLLTGWWLVQIPFPMSTN